MGVNFFDTNILVYSDDASNPEKQEVAIQLIADSIEKKNGAISIQVLQEYFVTVTRKLGVDLDRAQNKVETLISSLSIVSITELEVLGAIQLHRLDRVSFWDALIVTAAKTVNAAVLYSEDLQSGRKFGAALKVVNPF